jgi:hypothetical protein
MPATILGRTLFGATPDFMLSSEAIPHGPSTGDCPRSVRDFRLHGIVNSLIRCIASSNADDPKRKLLFSVIGAVSVIKDKGELGVA